MKLHSFKIWSSSQLASFYGILVAMFLALFQVALLLLTALFSHEASTQTLAPPPTPTPPHCVPGHLIAVWEVYLFGGSNTGTAGYLQCNLTLTHGGVLLEFNPANPSRCTTDYDPHTSLPITAAYFTVSPYCEVAGTAQTTHGAFTIDGAQMTLDHLLILGVGRDDRGIPQTFQAVRQPQPQS